jgi:hypothetical protein
MHDYYKLLGLERNATPKEIQAAYRKIAVKYHPDKMPSESGADEYFKIVTEGYNILSHPEKRARYTLLLEQVATLQVKQSKYENSYGKGDNRDPQKIKEKLARIKAFKRQEAIEQYKKREKQIPHFVRYPVIGLSIIFGYFFAFNRWFVNEASLDYLNIMFGLFVYVGATYFATNHLYIHLRALNFSGKWLRYPFEKTAVGFFILFFLGGPVTISTGNFIKKEYHLRNYPAFIVPEKVYITMDNKAIIHYKVGETEIQKSSSDYNAEELNFNMTYKQPIVRISKYNPKICRLEFQ